MAFGSAYTSLNLQKLENSEPFKGLERLLNKNNWFKPVLDYTEKSTNVNRVYIVVGTIALSFVTLLFHYGIQMVCVAVGFLYPSFKTIKALEKPGTEPEKRWLIYWLLFSAVNFLEVFLFFLHWLPGYWIVKCMFLIWCYAPVSKNGSDIIYEFLIHPFFQRNQEAIDNAINQIVRTTYSVYTNAEGYSTSNLHMRQPYQGTDS